jgi:hypothetical protein
MIAADFPPVVTSAALRMAGFVRHLPEHDWATSVVTIRDAFRRFPEADVLDEMCAGGGAVE